MSFFKGSINTVFDAFVLIEAARRGAISQMVSRPSTYQRTITPIEEGTLLIYDETETGIKRWSDGRLWSPSKFIDGFFLYHQLENQKHTEHCYKKNNSFTEEAHQKIKYRINYEKSLLKKCISGVAPDGHTFHLVHYHRNNYDSPIQLKFKDMDSILEAAKKYKYFKSFRTGSNCYNQLFYPEINLSFNFISTDSTPNSTTPNILLAMEHVYEKVMQDNHLYHRRKLDIEMIKRLDSQFT